MKYLCRMLAFPFFLLVWLLEKPLGSFFDCVLYWEHKFRGKE